jgi:hypothetical protein
LSVEQKNQAAEPFGAEGDYLSARKKLLDQVDELQRRTETRTTQMHDSAYQRARASAAIGG